MHGVCGGALQFCVDGTVQALSGWIRHLVTGEHRRHRLYSMSSWPIQQQVHDGVHELRGRSDDWFQWAAGVRHLQPHAAQHMCLVSCRDVRAAWYIGWEPDGSQRRVC